MTKVMATGAEELLIALQSPAPRGHLGVPTLLWGQPGEGKTSFVEALHRPDFPVVTLIASIHDPTDFSGLPVYEHQRVKFAPPDWALAFEEAQQGILFLDELTTAPPSVQAALLRVVLERKVGGKSLPDGVRIVAAANPPDAIAGGWELSPPLANRFVHICWSLSGSGLADAWQMGFARPDLPVIDRRCHDEAVASWRMMAAAFLRRVPSLAQTTPADGEYAFASPRTWDYAIQLMASCEVLGKAAQPGGRGTKVFYNLLQGAVGSGAAKSFIGFLKELRLPDANKVLIGKEQVAVDAMNDDELYVFFCSLSTAMMQYNRKRGAGPYVDATLRVLTLLDEVNANGRVDTVFAPVRHLALGQVLQLAAAAAHQEGRIEELQQLLVRVFDGTPLADYTRLLSDPS